MNPNVDGNEKNHHHHHQQQQCTYSFDETPILGGNSIDFTRLTHQANRIVLPFKFSWMGEFILRIDIFNDQTYDQQPYPGSERDLILSTTLRSTIWPNSSVWQHSQTIDSSLNSHQFSFRYRVSCSTHFYGSQCSRFCSPLSSQSRCDPETGDLICQSGWTGVDCHQGKIDFPSNEKLIIEMNICFCLAICRSGCEHGHCTNAPGQCFCHPGWTGERCHEKKIDEIIEKKISCGKCSNGGKCFGSICRCAEGFRGPSCDERICLNGGLSVLGQCRCAPNYSGSQCQIESKCPMCRNDGKCLNNKCVCTKDFIGQYCEINVRLIQKTDRRFVSMDLIILISVVTLFLVALIIVSVLFHKYQTQRRKQWQQVKNLNLEKIWTIESSSNNLYTSNDSLKEKLPEKDDIKSKLKQIDIHASLV